MKTKQVSAWVGVVVLAWLLAGVAQGSFIANPVGSKYDFSGRPSGDESDWVNRPVNLVSWYDAARYTNWLTTGNTENGVYEMTGLTSVGTILPHVTAAAILAVPVAYFIPTENEWYKAAYHMNDGLTGNYWDYPTSSDTMPGRDMTETTNPGSNAKLQSELFIHC